MSRVLPYKSPTLDYSLWEEIGLQSALVSEEQGKYLAERDRGESHRSARWTKAGRVRSELDDTVVYDFISLDDLFEQWFDMVRLNPTGLLEEIQKELKLVRGANEYFSEVDEEWLTIDWCIFGRVIGAAVANIGNSEKWWKHTGTDAKKSITFWGDFYRTVPELKTNYVCINLPDWENNVRGYREHNWDPETELSRADNHLPSSPFQMRISDSQFGKPTVSYYPNPLALLHFNRSKRHFSEMIVADKDEARANRLARSHGKRTMKLIEEAITELNRGNTAGFAIRIHGLCAAHVVRTSVMQQKIGLHLISNLGIRKETRLVGAQNVPDIAQYLKTGFHLGKVLHILQKSKIIKWNCIEKDVVEAAVKKLRP
jgi:hypothetical protein